MSDTLTQEERALIDAFPKDKVQHIPRGVSAFQDVYFFDGLKLVSKNPEASRAFFFGSRRSPNNQVQSRRAIVARKFGEGLTAGEIAAEMKESVSNVRNDIARLRLRRSDHPRKTHS